MVTPRLPPMDRRNDAAAVATASSFWGTEFCAATRSVCMQNPTPIPVCENRNFSTHRELQHQRKCQVALAWEDTDAEQADNAR